LPMAPDRNMHPGSSSLDCIYVHGHVWSQFLDFPSFL